MQVRPDLNDSKVVQEVSRDARVHNERQLQSMRLLPTFLFVGLIIGVIVAGMTLLPATNPPNNIPDAKVTTAPKPNPNAPK